MSSGRKRCGSSSASTPTVELPDSRDVVVGSTNASLFAYVADGAGGLKVLQLMSPESQPKFYGFSPEPKPQLIAQLRHRKPALSLSKGLDRDRAIDETGDQIAVFGRRGTRAAGRDEMHRLYLDARGKPWFVSDTVPDRIPGARPRRPTECRNRGGSGPRRAAFAVLALCVCGAFAAGAENTANAYKHLGVASCASSVCHGKITAQKDRDVALNEYTIWTHDDRHSQAYNRLKSPLALQIGAKLALANASNAKICLDCHADTVGAADAGPKFKFSDGVGCEACHGGAEKWLESHAQPTATHRDNLARGMYPSELPLQRATLCLSCHLGTRDKFATHVIIGAGHPRLSFELETFTANQPAHYVVDADYVDAQRQDRRHESLGHGTNRERGTLSHLVAERPLDAVRHDPGVGLLRLFRMSPYDRQPALVAAARGPRRQSRHIAFAEAESAHAASGGGSGRPGWPRGPGRRNGRVDPRRTSRSAVLAGRRAAAPRATARDEAWSRPAYSPVEIAKVRKILVRYAAEDKASDFGAAEQIVLGVDSLSHSLNDYDRRRAPLDALYDGVKSGANFNATQFAEAARRVQGQF